MFNKKKFDKINGEDRICSICTTPFHAIRAITFCPKCATQKQQSIRQKKLEEGKIQLKQPYPYIRMHNGKREYAWRFKQLQSKLNKIKKRVDWKQYLKERLDEVLNDEVLMKWINDRRDNETKKANQIKSNNQTKKEYPNTKGLYID
jgi:hypothetical protein